MATEIFTWGLGEGLCLAFSKIDVLRMSGRKAGNLEKKRGRLFFRVFSVFSLFGTKGEMTRFFD